MYFNKAKLHDLIFYQLLMWFWPVNEMTELVSGMPAPAFGAESSLSARIRAGSESRVFLYLILIYVRCFLVSPKIYSCTPWVLLLQVENHSSKQSVHRWR
jgi:hypothetical protein